LEAARCAERLIDHATRTRQARTKAPRKPRAAPTTMNTVPSGRLDLCMNGALLVSGTIRDGIDVTTPAIVGALERKPELVVDGALVAGVVEIPDASLAVDAVVAVVAVVAVEPVTVDRFGKSVSPVCARDAVANRRMQLHRRMGAIVLCFAMLKMCFQALEQLSNRKRLSSSDNVVKRVVCVCLGSVFDVVADLLTRTRFDEARLLQV